MKSINKSRIFKIILELILCFNLLNISLIYASSEEYDTPKIHINTVKDFESFVQNCSLDSYSQNKTFVLTEDIDLTGHEFTSIPTFGGIFDGNGHTIKGLNLKDNGSNLALFRYVQEDGTIKNLNVIGTVSPEGTSTNIGGIVGTNNGRILSSSFRGNVYGKESIGGIAGLNNPNGYISNCVSSAFVIGEKFTGGISGTNHGIIIQSSNKGNINTLNMDVSPTISDINLRQSETSEDVILHTDSGGIAGFSDGIVQSCENAGKIGYQHVGYNVGGIIGRQSGYVSNCKNLGEVLGRKDVGGIVGQMEPYLAIKFSEDIIQKLDKELDSLSSLIDKTLTDANIAGVSTSESLSNLNSLTNQASTEFHEVVDQTTNFTDETVDVVNSLSFRISLLLEEMELVLGDFDIAGEHMTSGLNEVSMAFSDLENASSKLTISTKDLQSAFKDLSSSLWIMSDAMRKMERANKMLSNNLGDPEKIAAAKKNFNEALDSFEDASNNISNIINTIADILSNIGDLGGIDWKQVSENLYNSSLAFSSNVEVALKEMRNALSELSNIVIDDIDTLKSFFDIIGDSFGLLEVSAILLEDFSSHTSDALSNIESATEHSSEAMNKLSKASKELKNSSNYMNSAIKKSRSILNDFNEEPHIEFPKLGDKVKQPTDDLFSSFDEISKELETLNDQALDSQTVIINDLKEINRKMSSIFQILIDAKKAALEGYDLYSDISKDTPESMLEDENKITKGAVVRSINSGEVSGDINIGGVVGSMAFDYDFDPEGDLTEDNDTSLNFQYQTRSILYKSINKGNVTSKKDYVGGVAGRMDLGMLSQCENYGHINSSNGSYIGGIAGFSSSTIKNSYAKCKLYGRSYVGGIAGQGYNIYNSYTMVKIYNAIEYAGSISGEITGDFKDNFFVKDRWAGIDNISYANKATPQDYDTFIKNEHLPNEFKNFILTFKANDEIIKTLEFHYGDSLKSEEQPVIPEKKGYYSSWPDYDFDNLLFSDTLEAIYNPLITTIASYESSPDIPPKLLVEGTFGPDSQVLLSKNTDNLPSLNEEEIIIESYTSSIIGGFEEDNALFTLRYYYPHSTQNTSVMVLSENHWRNINFKAEGSYLIFETSTKDTTFCVIESPSNYAYLYVSSGVFMALLILLIFLRKNKKSNAEVSL